MFCLAAIQSERSESSVVASILFFTINVFLVTSYYYTHTYGYSDLAVITVITMSPCCWVIWTLYKLGSI